MKKVIAVFIAVVMAVSCLSVNVFAVIEFDGTSKTNQELWSAWLKEFKDFTADPANKADDMIKANHALTVGLAKNGQTAIGNTSADIGDFIGSMTEEICTTGRISDDTLTKFRNIFTEEGFQCDNEAFEQWYQDKFGKNYRPKSMINGKEGDYYIKCETANGGFKYIYILKYSGKPLTVYKNNAGVQYFLGSDMGGFSYRCYTKSLYASGEWSDWQKGNWYDNSTTTSIFVLGDTSVSSSYDRINTTTNLPLNYWGDIIGGDPITDWDSLGDDFAEGEGEGLTADELGDLTDDLLQALLDNMPDLTTTNGILQAIYRKCCEISNKIGKQATNVYKQTLQGIQTSLDKVNAFCSSFWTDFSNSMQTLFIPEENYAADKYDALIETFNNKFGFASEIKSEIDDCITLLDKPPVSTFSIHYKSIKLDLSVFDSHIDLIRYCVAIPIYFGFFVRIYRKTPWYMQGGGE